MDSFNIRRAEQGKLINVVVKPLQWLCASLTYSYLRITTLGFVIISTYLKAPSQDDYYCKSCKRVVVSNMVCCHSFFLLFISKQLTYLLYSQYYEVITELCRELIIIITITYILLQFFVFINYSILRYNDYIIRNDSINT